MKTNGYLVIGSNGSTRFVKNKVGLSWNEILIKVSIEIPDSVFSRPLLEANIKLEGDFENKFDFEVRKNLQDLIDTDKNLHLVNINILPKEINE